MKNTDLNALVRNIDNIELLAKELNRANDEAEVQAALEAHGLDITVDEMIALSSADEVLTEDDLLDVVGGCKCKGWLKRAINNFLGWLYKKATNGGKLTCPECGD